VEEEEEEVISSFCATTGGNGTLPQTRFSALTGTAEGKQVVLLVNALFERSKRVQLPLIFQNLELFSCGSNLFSMQLNIFIC
jgi:hypothetical protein